MIQKRLGDAQDFPAPTQVSWFWRVSWVPEHRANARCCQSEKRGCHSDLPRLDDLIFKANFVGKNIETHHFDILYQTLSVCLFVYLILSDLILSTYL